MGSFRIQVKFGKIETKVEEELKNAKARLYMFSDGWTTGFDNYDEDVINSSLDIILENRKNEK